MGTSEGVVGAADLYQAAIHQLLQHFDTADAADGFDFCSDDWLTVGDDRQCFQGGRCQFQFRLTLVQFAQPMRESWPCQQLIPGSNLLDAKGRALPVIDFIQLPDQGAGFRRIGQQGELGQLTRRQRPIGHQQHRFHSGHFRSADSGDAIGSWKRQSFGRFQLRNLPQPSNT